jgi:hypothetical protein
LGLATRPDRQGFLGHDPGVTRPGWLLITRDGSNVVTRHA